MSPRKMGEGSWLRVMFGAQPYRSPMRRQSGCALIFLCGLAGITAGLVVAGHAAMGLL